VRGSDLAEAARASGRGAPEAGGAAAAAACGGAGWAPTGAGEPVLGLRVGVLLLPTALRTGSAAPSTEANPAGTAVGAMSGSVDVGGKASAFEAAAAPSIVRDCAVAGPAGGWRAAGVRRRAIVSTARLAAGTGGGCECVTASPGGAVAGPGAPAGARGARRRADATRLPNPR
jgi:hypothetical protein